MKGTFNKLLSVQLTGKTITDEKIDEAIFQEYLGGRGLGVKLFTDRVPKNLDPLGEDNQLIFATGPITGTAVPTSGRFALVTKSPLTGTIFYSNTGGFIAPMFKRCGYDAMAISGKLDAPGYLLIDGENNTEIKSADGLWGLDTRETMAKLKEIEGKNVHVLMIGPAGENLVSFAAIMNDGDHRAFGRGGVGAVMGSKNLKAIVVKSGKAKVETHDPDRLKKFVQTAYDKIKVVPITNSALPMFGTAGLVNIINELGMLPTNNFQKGASEHADKISGEAIREKILVKDEGCYACPIRCGRLTKAGSMEGKGPEYESVVLLGSNLGIFDLEVVTQANYLCNLYGLDTISTGGVIGCAMELAQKGKLSVEGVKFGNTEILLKLVKQIAFKEGFGKDLAQGVVKLAAQYGSPASAIHVKGLDLPAYDPRGSMGHALGYATSNRGGCHLTGYLAAMEIFAAPKKIPRLTTGGKADLLVLKQHQSVIEDSLIVCKFAGWAVGMDFSSRFATAITGEEMDITRLMIIGERVYNLERMYNLQEGITGETDTLPKRFTDEPFTEGYSKGQVVPLKNMLKDYYAVRKWDSQGVPTPEKLAALNLSAAGTQE